MSKFRYFEPGTAVWVRSDTLTDRYPGKVIQRQSGVYKILWLETDEEVLVPAKDVSLRHE